MKAIRTYKLIDGVLYQRTLMSALFDPDSDELDNDVVIEMSIRVDPDAVSALCFHLGVSSVDARDDFQFIVSAPDDCGLDILLSEMEHFINVVKSMFYGS